MLPADLWHDGATQVVLRLCFTVAETVASCTFVRQTGVCPTKVLALRGCGVAPKSRHLKTRTMDVNDDDDKRSFKYSFRLNEEQNMRFCRMLEEAGMSGNRSRFIVRRIFGEEFRIVKTDPTMARYITLLNKFYAQFQRIGNNYNQIVRAVNTHFSTVAIPKQMLALEQETRKLKALSEQIIALSEKLHAAWSHE